MESRYFSNAKEKQIAKKKMKKIRMILHNQLFIIQNNK